MQPKRQTSFRILSFCIKTGGSNMSVCVVLFLILLRITKSSVLNALTYHQMCCYAKDCPLLLSTVLVIGASLPRNQMSYERWVWKHLWSIQVACSLWSRFCFLHTSPLQFLHVEYITWLIFNQVGGVPAMNKTQTFVSRNKMHPNHYPVPFP